ncbi:MAG: hypothetical protein RL134_1667 [Actinomycetota bacterium]
MPGPHPIRRLGAESPGGLQLPAAIPTAGTMYAPRGVWTDGTRLVVSDTGNQRVLIWHSMPTADGQDADVVLGQPDFASEGPQASGAGPARGFHLPTGVDVIDGNLVVADGWNHRILVFDGVPTESYAAPVSVIGQPDDVSVEANAGGEPTLTSFYWPFGFAVVGDSFWVADTGNRRVLGWHGPRVPEPGRPADMLLGQDAGDEREDNRGGQPTHVSFRWPHAISGDAETLYIADAGDHRVLGWSPHPTGDDDATLVLGQADFTSAEEFKNRPQGAQRMRFPYGVAVSEGRLAVGDTSNNRILIWDRLPRSGAAIPADHVLAQPNFDTNGENRWDVVADDSLCWPYGICLRSDLLAIADSGNNRVMLWRLA